MPALSGYHRGVKAFGAAVRAVRESRDLQQMQVARAVTATEREAKSLGNYLSRIERGDERNPSLEMLEQIAKGLGLTLSGFFLQIEQQEPRSQTSVLHLTDNLENTGDLPDFRLEGAASHGHNRELLAALASLTARLDRLEGIDLDRRFAALERRIRRDDRQRTAAADRESSDPHRRKKSKAGKGHPAPHRKAS